MFFRMVEAFVHFTAKLVRSLSIFEFQISNLDSDRDSVIFKNNIRRDFLQLKESHIAR